MLPQEIIDKIQAKMTPDAHDGACMELGAEIAYTHQQEIFHKHSKLVDEYVDDMEAKYQRAMVKLEQLHAARYIGMNLPKSEVADLFTEYKTKHDL